jgi:hypothetical protein
MHDNKGRTQAGRYDVDKLLAGVIQDTTGNTPGVSICHQFEGWVLILFVAPSLPMSSGKTRIPSPFRKCIFYIGNLTRSSAASGLAVGLLSSRVSVLSASDVDD